MTAERMYESICKMIIAHAEDVGDGAAQKVIDRPEEWVSNSVSTFYEEAAALLIDTRKKMDTRTTSRTVIAAVKRVIDSAYERTNGLFQQDGLFCACDGYRLIRLHSDISSLPHKEGLPLDAARAMECPRDIELSLPSVAEVKAYIAAHMAAHGRRAAVAYWIDGRVKVNAKYLLDMLQALPNCRAYMGKSYINPVYFVSDNGDDGILLPVRPTDEEKRQIETVQREREIAEKAVKTVETVEETEEHEQKQDQTEETEQSKPETGFDVTHKSGKPTLTGKYAKLRDDLSEALRIGRDAETDNPEDGGTSNFDAVSINLPRWNRAKVEQAAEEAGTSCFIWILYSHKSFVFEPDSLRQGNARIRNAIAMARAMKSMGYDAYTYNQSD